MIALSEVCPIFNSNLMDIQRHVTKNDNDWLQVNGGQNGVGKSNFSLYGCGVLDEHFTIKQVAYSPDDFFTILDNVDKYQAVLIDEGGEWLFSRNWNTKEAKDIVTAMMILREKNLFFWVNIENIRFIDVYIKVSRMRAYTNVFTIDNLVLDGGVERMERMRGFFAAYSKLSLEQHFFEKKAAYPDFLEMFEDIRELDGGVKLWEEYHSLKGRFLEKRKKEREKAKAEELKIRVKKSDVARNSTIGRKVAEFEPINIPAYPFGNL